MKQTALLLGLHCHQPVDNFYEVVDEAIERSYLPFFEVASKYESFKFSIHYSGWLLEYIQTHAPKLFALMQSLSHKGQIEFLSGGYYEPILASIPSKDRIAQIQKLNDFIKKHFGQEPKGLWLTERVWDSTIVKDLVACKIEYVVVDDYHFIAAGFEKERLNGYFLTEDEGKVLKIFPINKTLRYNIPFEKPKKVEAYLKSIANTPISAGVIFDDGEKFGIWPKTYEWVYEKGWLKEFIETILQNPSITPLLYQEYLQQCKPISLAYLPITSYIEMGEWALSAKDNLTLHRIKEALAKEFEEEAIEKFVKGSVWKNFLIKYKEANRIHKRFLELSNERIDDKNYLESLYKAQTNDVLWHGVFGGIYLPNLRDNAYRFLIDCENIKHPNATLTQIKDTNFDGFVEIKMLTKDLLAILDTKEGGQLVEFDIRDRSFNLQNTLTRYFESYHQKVLEPTAKEQNPILEKEIIEEAIATIHDIEEDLSHYKEKLHHDWYTKNSFIDHISDEQLNLLNFEAATFSEYGDFTNQPYQLLEAKEQKATLKRDGGIYLDGKKFPTTLTKTYWLQEKRLSCNIEIQSTIEKPFTYLLEHNFHFANLKGLTLSIDNGPKQKLSLPLEVDYCETVALYDSYTQKEIVWRSEPGFRLYLSALNTLSQSESGFDLTNQGITIGSAFSLIQTAKIDTTVWVK